MQAPVSAHANPERYHSIDAAKRFILFLTTPMEVVRVKTLDLCCRMLRPWLFRVRRNNFFKHSNMSPIHSQLSLEFREIIGG